MAKKNKSRQKKIYSLGGRSSYQGNFNLGKGQLDRMQDDSKISSTNLNATEKTLIETDLKKWGFEYWEGIFRLSKNSNSELKKIFPVLRYTLVREGEVVVIRKRTEGKEYFLLADIDYNEEEKTKNIKRNLGGEIVELKVKYHNRKGLIGNLSNKSEIEKNDFDITDVIIFYNNSQGEGELKRGQHQIKKIVKIEEQFLKDLETSRPRILAYHPLINTKSKAEMLKKYIFEEANDLITIASLNEGDKPSLHNWVIDSKQENLWQNYHKTFTEWKRLNGIRTNTNKKNKPQVVKEIELVEEQFEALENSRYNALMEGLEEALEKWNWEYKLLRPDEAEEEEVDKNIKQLEKQLKLTFLQQKIRKLEEVNIKHTEEEKILNIPSK